jgi:prepilin peptidase dependent protein B
MPFHAARRKPSGFSLVETLVALAIGLLVVSAAIVAVNGSLRENHRLVLDARLHQDLRTAVEVMTRDLRRAGHWAGASTGHTLNPYALALAPAAFDAKPLDQIAFAYSRDAVENHILDPNERFAYRLRRSAIEMQLGQGNWQAMTDAGTMTVSSLSFTPQLQEIELTESRDGACQPRLQVRSIALRIDAHATADRRIARSVQSVVRLRNDHVDDCR